MSELFLQRKRHMYCLRYETPRGLPTTLQLAVQPTALSTPVFVDLHSAAFPRAWNDLLYVEWDIKFYTLTHPCTARPLCGR